MSKILLFVGKSCAGKDTLAKKIKEELNIPMALSYTTRPKRLGEKDGREYYFINSDAFAKLKNNNELIEYTSYIIKENISWEYGLTKNELEKNDYVIAIVNPEGAKKIKEYYNDKVIIFYILADDKERVYRYLNRDNSDISECCRRFLADEKDFKDIKYDFKIINNEIENAFEDFNFYISIIKGNEHLKETRFDFLNNPNKYLGDNNA